MKAGQYVIQLAQQIAVIEAMEGWDAEEKIRQIQLLHDSATDSWRRYGMAMVDHLLRQNKNSQLDFAPELKNGLAKAPAIVIPPAQSVAQKVERKAL